MEKILLIQFPFLFTELLQYSDPLEVMRSGYQVRYDLKKIYRRT